MNSTVQCLFRVPELRQSLAAYALTSAADPAHKLTMATKQLFTVSGPLTVKNDTVISVLSLC